MSEDQNAMPVDILAIAAHRDDVELTCAGTLLRAADQGYRTGILDLTAGETGTSGTAAIRGAEAERAAGILRLTQRRNAGLPDAGLYNTEESRRIVVEAIRHFAPRVVVLPYPVGRHPDHRVASELGRDACYLAGLRRYNAKGAPHRPFKILYALAYREDPVKPTFVVDITEQFDRKIRAIRSYASQFDDAEHGHRRHRRRGRDDAGHLSHLPGQWGFSGGLCGYSGGGLARGSRPDRHRRATSSAQAIGRFPIPSARSDARSPGSKRGGHHFARLPVPVCVLCFQRILGKDAVPLGRVCGGRGERGCGAVSHAPHLLLGRSIRGQRQAGRGDCRAPAARTLATRLEIFAHLPR